jgi:hypothetical protein
MLNDVRAGIPARVHKRDCQLQFIRCARVAAGNYALVIFNPNFRLIYSLLLGMAAGPITVIRCDYIRSNKRGTGIRTAE